MHKVRHPIALFIVTVLAVIGIRIGVVAATQTSKVYGPPGARFTVTFPGRVYEQDMKLPMPDAGIAYNSQGPYTGRSPNESSINDGVSAQYILSGVSPHDLRELVLRFKAGLGFPLGQHLTRTTEHVNGFLLTRLGPLCEQTLCL